MATGFLSASDANVLDNFTKRVDEGDKGASISVVDDGGEDAIRINPSNPDHAVHYSIDPAGTAADAELVVRHRSDSSSSVTQGGVGARVANGLSNHNSYIGHTEGSNDIGVAKYVSGTYSVLSDTFNARNDSYKWIRFRANGTDVKVKEWTGTPDDEPASWTLETTDTDITAAGYLTLFAEQAFGNPQFYTDIGWATGGDTAPTEPVSGGTTVTGSATLSGSGAVTASALVTLVGSAVLAGAGALTADSSVAHSGSATLEGQGAVTAQAAVTHTGVAALEGQGSLSATSALIARGVAALDGVGTLTVAGTLDTGALQGQATLDGQGALAAQGFLLQRSDAALDGVGALSAEANVTLSGIAALDGGGALSAVPTLTLGGVAALDGSGALAADPRLVVRTTATLDGIGSLNATPLFEELRSRESGWNRVALTSDGRNEAEITNGPGNRVAIT